MKFENLLFSEVRDQHPDRYEKADLAETSIVEHDVPGQFIVSRNPSADSHVAALVHAVGEYWGSCSCKGYEHHEGPCSHLCAIVRAEHREIVRVPKAHVMAIEPAVLEDDREVDLADEDDGAADADVAEAMADGGEIVPPTSGADGEVFGRPESRL